MHKKLLYVISEGIINETEVKNEYITTSIPRALDFCRSDNFTIIDKYKVHTYYNGDITNSLTRWRKIRKATFIDGLNVFNVEIN